MKKKSWDKWRSLSVKLDDAVKEYCMDKFGCDFVDVSGIMSEKIWEVDLHWINEPESTKSIRVDIIEVLK